MDPDCRRALKAMSDLFALRLVENDMMFRWAGAWGHVGVWFYGCAQGYGGSTLVQGLPCPLVAHGEAVSVSFRPYRCSAA